MITIAYDGSNQLKFFSMEEQEAGDTMDSVTATHNTMEFLDVICNFTSLVLPKKSIIFWEELDESNSYDKWCEFRSLLMLEHKTLANLTMHDMFSNAYHKYNILPELYELYGTDFYNIVYKNFYEPMILESIVECTHVECLIQLYRNLVFYETVFSSTMFSLDDKIDWMARGNYTLLVELFKLHALDTHIFVNANVGVDPMIIINPSDDESEYDTDYDSKLDSMTVDNDQIDTFTGKIHEYYCQYVALGHTDKCEIIRNMYSVFADGSIVENIEHSYMYKIACLYNKYGYIKSIGSQLTAREIISEYFTLNKLIHGYNNNDFCRDILCDLLILMCEYNENVLPENIIERYIEMWLSITSMHFTNNTFFTMTFQSYMCKRHVILSDTLARYMNKLSILYHSLDYVFYHDRLDMYDILVKSSTFNSDKLMTYSPQSIIDKYDLCNIKIKSINKGSGTSFIHSSNNDKYYDAIKKIDRLHVLSHYNKEWFEHGNVEYTAIAQYFVTLYYIQTTSDYVHGMTRNVYGKNATLFEQLMYFFIVGVPIDFEIFESVLSNTTYNGVSPCDIYNELSYFDKNLKLANDINNRVLHLCEID
jgi:hypothetical protein